MRIVTSMGPAGFELYGRRFLESYVRFGRAPLTVWIEEAPDRYPASPAIEYRPLAEVPHLGGFLSFLERERPDACTDFWRMNLYKFCRKSFVQVHELSAPGEPVVWMDADVLLVEPVDLAPQLERLGSAFVGYMGREGAPGTRPWAPCTSLVLFDPAHPDCARFRDAYLDVHLSGEVLELPEWHDGFVFDHVRRRTGVASVDLAADCVLSRPAVNVFDEVCSPWGRHLKGERRKEQAARGELGGAG